jgi:hypothetical protein
LPEAFELNQEWRNEDAHRYSLVRGDFNGDGVLDEVRLLVRARGSGLAIFAFVSQDKGPFRAILLDEKQDTSYINVLGIASVAPGLYKTACGKGYFNCGEGEPAEILLRHQGIRYYKIGSASSIFYWDDRTNAFKLIAISD